jgi:geranylgeranyl diphosphate synthase, type II
MFPIEELQKKINEEIVRRSTVLNARQPAELYAPIDYSLGVGGKRLRPVCF